MNLMGMRFKGFTWRDNPTSLTVNDSRNVKETVLPYAGARTEDLGRQKRKVSGEGYFTGEDCWNLWNALYETYGEGGPGSLQLPGQEPFLAVMDSLKLIGAAGENLVKYGFSFTECRAGQEHDGSGTYSAVGGESLWDYAYRYGRTIEEMLEANPGVRDIGVLKEGEEVRVP